jgi:protease I
MAGKPLLGLKAAILVANGFCEADVTQTQRALLELGAAAKIISPEVGLACGWAGENWGHNCAVDANIRTALGADYSMLIVPGGIRSVEKLRLTAHTKRFISSFINSGKPVAVFDESLELLAAAADLSGRTVAGAPEMEAPMLQAGVNWAGAAWHADNNLLTATTAAGREEVIAETMKLFTAQARAVEPVGQAA